VAAAARVSTLAAASLFFHGEDKILFCVLESGALETSVFFPWISQNNGLGVHT
jgi:hypothetical protein